MKCKRQGNQSYRRCQSLQDSRQYLNFWSARKFKSDLIAAKQKGDVSCAHGMSVHIIHGMDVSAIDAYEGVFLIIHFH